MAPWLSTRKVMCHGDFHKENVLLKSCEDGLQPWLIDFDSAEVGHPFFDVFKFSLRLKPEQRNALLQTYLGGVPNKRTITFFE